MNPDEIIAVQEIEDRLVAHDTSSIFVFPELISDIVYQPELQHANGTPVYHVVGEVYREYSSRSIEEFVASFQDIFPYSDCNPFYNGFSTSYARTFE